MTRIKLKELQIMSYLRSNARESLTKISRKTGIPISTIYEKLKAFENTVIKKHTCIIDFKEFGFDIKVTLLLKTSSSKKEELKKFLTTHHLVNMVFCINNGYDFLVEAIFANITQLHQFIQSLEQKGVKAHKEFFILEEIQRESFLTNKSHIDLITKT